ncbi:sulfotransferase family 2 domain-containing protein [Chromobacterium subtsugae]|uniref:sulfotransferase family 2 domain-containing protein n=1 Tax=Chromobacterium subtsugae TaxID=251747 RepID=UPI000641396C|nr:sulfotransferase family 2 domain-containing protein [Chromobacterium subtsugae]
MAAELPKLAFVHIPRTAGTAFGHALDQLYQGRRTAKFYADEEVKVANGKIEAFCRLNGADKQGFDLLRGHFVHGFDPALRGFDYVALLREPVRRLISYYFYALKDKRNYLHSYLLKRRLGLEPFLLSDASIDLDNYQVRAISGAQFASVREPVSQRHCDEAKRKLAEEFAAFGLTERFDESMARFARKFGWNLPAPGKMNAGSYGPELELSAACRERVLEKNRFDVELYQFACRLFEAGGAAAEQAGIPIAQERTEDGYA